MHDIKDEIISRIAKHLEAEDIQLEIPPDSALGDYAMPCFILARKDRKSPIDIAKELCEKIEVGGIIRKIQAEGPYVNFYINETLLAESLIKEILAGRTQASVKKKVILVESPGPNTNKPLHLGHLRNMLLGQSIIRILRKIGHEVHHVNIVNDRGVHICKSMLAYKLYGQDKTPDSEGIKSDHFVGDYYVKYSEIEKENPDAERMIQEMLVKWEEADKEIRMLWAKMNNWALKGFKETYDRLGIKIEKEYHESEIYKHGKDIILKGLDYGIFEKDKDGAIVADLEKDGLGRKILLRANLTSVYITQDIYLAKLRYDDFKYDSLVYVVANEQMHHFKVLFKILERLGYPFAENCHHFAYGMVELPEGKMKSREGNVVDTDDLIDEMGTAARAEVKNRYPDLDEKEMQERAGKIAMAAIKFFFLKFDPLKDFVFNPKESLAFEGETGPYVQYTHARIDSILRKAGKRGTFETRYLTEKETRSLVKKLLSYNEAVKLAGEKHNPAAIARYLIELCQAFNEFYHLYPVLREEEHIKQARLALIEAVKITIAEGLQLLGIDAPERM